MAVHWDPQNVNPLKNLPHQELVVAVFVCSGSEVLGVPETDSIEKINLWPGTVAHSKTRGQIALRCFRYWKLRGGLTQNRLIMSDCGSKLQVGSKIALVLLQNRDVNMTKVILKLIFIYPYLYYFSLLVYAVLLNA
ncbi:hypothetical protein AVEN_214286-1 [Araneus ventricosus]|uniref:Uncharacterized protein n=1 Tax=Araneus ventricosus TaxID=182803 RepID=A0A4Y2KYM5_ARAVE|nr:hypothetical protein AVEN_214286-1 [Araneus ventricosus]